MQKRLFLSGVPYWIGIYNDEPNVWIVVGELGGELVQAVSSTQQQAIEEWQEKAAPRLNAPSSGPRHKIEAQPPARPKPVSS